MRGRSEMVRPTGGVLNEAMSDSDPKPKHQGYRQEPKPLTDAEKKALSGLDDLKRGEKSGSGCLSALGCWLKIGLIVASLAGIVAFVWWWHPWETRSTEVSVDSPICAENERGIQFAEQVYVLGFQISDKRKGVICIETDDEQTTTGE